jgi:hypothetical protein
VEKKKGLSRDVPSTDAKLLSILPNRNAGKPEVAYSLDCDGLVARCSLFFNKDFDGEKIDGENNSDAEP